MYIMRSGGFQSRSASKSSMSRGAIRARMFNKSWKCASLKKVIDKFAPGSKAKLSENGKKIIYENGVSSKRVVYDKDGNYFRIEDTSAQGKRVYVDMNGNIPNNRVENGRTIGNSQSIYNSLTHFNNIDD